MAAPDKVIVKDASTGAKSIGVACETEQAAQVLENMYASRSVRVRALSSRYLWSEPHQTGRAELACPLDFNLSWSRLRRPLENLHHRHRIASSS